MSKTWCRSKVWLMYIFGDQCWISCLPQQKWHINFKITEEEFKARWSEIEVKGKYDKFTAE